MSIYLLSCWSGSLMDLKNYKSPVFIKTMNIEEVLIENKRKEMQIYKYFGIYALSGACVSLAFFYIVKRRNKEGTG